MSGYSVFLSSTFADLKEERVQARKALELIPAAVLCAENCGSAGEPLWPTLKKLIDKADAVVLIIGQRSGASGESGEPWTEKEVRYAIENNKRVFAYIREELPDRLVRQVDVDKSAKRKLEQFISFIEEKLAIVPRFRRGEYWRLIGMLVRDVDRYFQQVEAEKQHNSYTDSYIA